MTISQGTQFGPYRIVELIGSGGMGEVYRAQDTRLGREVAIKLVSDRYLTEAFGSGSPPAGSGTPATPGTLSHRRFLREAQSASVLNHSNICTIYDIGEQGGRPYLVMELLRGETLKEALRHETLSVTEVVAFSKQIASGLAAAHAQGIVHRDIKPANIFVVGGEGKRQVKILDFGLAKQHGVGDLAESGDATATFGGQATSAGTMTNFNPELTSPGSTLGTVAYMSPEQARGFPLDVRSDLFSLGSVMFEMATGKTPFPGASPADIFAALLKDQVPAVSVVRAQEGRPAMPAGFDEIVAKLLEKDKEQRYQKATDVERDLEELGAAGSGSGVRAATGIAAAQSGVHPVAEKKSVGKLTAAAVILLLLAVVGFAAWHFWPRPQPFASITVSQMTNVGTIEKVALSADGKFLAEVKNESGQRSLWLKNTATNTDTQILGAYGGSYVGLIFSADGNYLYFTRGTLEDQGLHVLFVMPVFGGTPRQLIYDIDSTPSFAPDGRRFTFLRYTPGRKDQFTEVHIADKDGGHDQVFYTSKEELSSPLWSPDGSRIAWVQHAVLARKVVLGWIDVASKKVDTAAAPADIVLSLAESVTSLAWLPDNRHLLVLYLKPRTDRTQIGIMTLPSGEFSSLTNDVNSYSELAVSGDGRTLATVLTNVDSSIAYYKAEGGAPISATPLRITPRAIAWADEDHLLYIVRGISVGSLDRTTGNLHPFEVGDVDLAGTVSTCPDGHILFSGFPKGGGEARIFRMNADGGDVAQITTTGIARGPVCSADSREVKYSLREGTGSSIWSIPVAGGTAKELLPTGTAVAAVSISGDGKLVAFSVDSQLTSDIEAVDLASKRVVFRGKMDASDFGDSVYRFSSDSRALVYAVRRDGGVTLLYQPLDGSAPHTLIDPGATINDFGWSPSGKQLAVARVKSSSDVVLITDKMGH